MDRIFNKLLPVKDWIAMVLLAITFCFFSLYPSMTGFAVVLNFKVNIYITTLIGGVVAWGVFELLAMLYFLLVKKIQPTIEILSNHTYMMKILRWFMMVKNLIIGGVRLAYIFNPMLVPLFEAVIVLPVTVGIYFAYYLYVRRRYIVAQNYSRSILAFCGPYLVLMILGGVGGIFI